MTRSPLVAALALVPTILSAQPADHEIARHAVGRGDMLPLERILAGIETNHPGRIVEVELEDEGGLWLYEVEILTPGGRLIELELDPRTGTVLSLKEDDD